MTVVQERPAPEATPADDVTAWLGIRYARAQRFRAPELVELDLRKRYETYGAAPFQFEDPLQPLGAAPAEDCHFLNIWAPERRAGDGPLPVIVSIYGGGFEHGASSSWVADGRAVAATGRAVFVSFNYRVGALGFATLDHLGRGYEDTSNLGLRDVIAALTWVHREIDRFGGDPGAVTVVGESAGGFLTTALAAAPSARGLFQRMAVFSAGASRVIPLEASRAMGRKLVRTVCDDDARTVAQVSAANWTTAQSAVTSGDIGVRNGPVPRAFGVVDDHAAARPVLEGHPMTAIENGALTAVPLLVSAMRDEIALFREMSVDFDPVDASAVVDEVESWGVSRARATEIVADAANEIVGSRELTGDECPPPGVLRAAVLTDYIYRLPAARLARAHADAGGTAYLQLVGRVDGVAAGHALDVPALVGKHWPDSTAAARARDRELFTRLLDFATGDTNDWEPVPPDAVPAHGIAELDRDATEIYRAVLARWDGVPRP